MDKHQTLDNHQTNLIESVNKIQQSFSRKGQDTCRICKKFCGSHEELKDHMQDNHRRIIQCVECKEIFKNSYELENHRITFHKEERSFNCDECESKVIVAWRLKKHKEMHRNDKLQTCHYFNNGKTCPFTSIGCKFLHRKLSCVSFLYLHRHK